MHCLDARQAVVEYWFLKFNAGRLAFLVDLIVRRHRAAAEVRLSFWVDGNGRVERIVTPTWLARDGRVSIADASFHRGSCRGQLADVSWDLTYELGQVLDPLIFPLNLMRPADMQIISYPRARFHGTVRVGAETFIVADARGLISHYWGARLPERWYWMSANQFTGQDLALEALVAFSRLWGARWPRMWLGYVFLSGSDRTSIVASPLNGLIQVAEKADGWTLACRSIAPSASCVLHCTVAPASTNDLGEGISQTLVGSLRLEAGSSVATASGTAGLEVRRV